MKVIIIIIISKFNLKNSNHLSNEVLTVETNVICIVNKDEKMPYI